MSRITSWLSRLGPDAGPRETLEWVRRIEIATGGVGVLVGLLEWTAGWWHWLVLAGGVVGLSPWPGARQILRRAERRPEVLNHDRARGYVRARRTVHVLWPSFTLITAAIGYAYGRWLGAALNIVLIGGGGAAEGWLALRSLDPRRHDQ